MEAVWLFDQSLGSNSSFTFPQPSNGSVHLKDGKLWLSKIGAVKIKLHRPLQGRIKTATIIRKAGRWYACFSVEMDQPEPLPKMGKDVGIDVGVESLATLSDGTQIENPRWYRKAERRLTKAQRRVSRRKRGSNRHHKAVRLLQRAHEKVQNQRKDFHHKLSRKLVNQYDRIYYEDLNIQNMVKNCHLAKSISDAGWGQFLRYVCYKAEEAGRDVVAVTPQWTNQKCSGCEEIVIKSLSQRWHRCPHCGLELHRDHNAAVNIQRLGRSLQGVPTEVGAMN
ncbi:MAG: RNA-guided endonuclease InsQ/TnpB family protein [Candidatus Bipolaricaulia bacterium]